MYLRGVWRRHEGEKSGVAMRIKENKKNGKCERSASTRKNVGTGRKNVKTSERCVEFSDPLYKRGALKTEPIYGCYGCMALKGTRHPQGAATTSSEKQNPPESRHKGSAYYYYFSFGIPLIATPCGFPLFIIVIPPSPRANPGIDGC